MIIGINGYMGSGKDLVAKMIQYLDITHRYKNRTETNWTLEDLVRGDLDLRTSSLWEVKKFAYKLKQMVSLLTGIPVEDLEKQEVKDRQLGSEWDRTIRRIRTMPSFHGERMLSIDELELTRNPGEYFQQYDNHIAVRVPTTVRELLQKLGTEAVRNQVHVNAWVNALFADYKPIRCEEYLTGIEDSGVKEKGYEPVYPSWVISDCRFPNEAQAIKDKGGIVIRVNRPEASQPDMDLLSKEPYPPVRHSSETSLDNWKFDYIIDNSVSLEDLLERTKGMLNHFNLLK